MPILVRMGSKPDTCTTRSTWKGEKPYGTHPSHGSRDIPTFGPNRFNCNLRSHRGTECRSLSGWARNPIPALREVLGRRRNRSEPIRVTDPEISLLSARIGLIVIYGVIGEQNADPCPDGLETRYLHYPKYLEGGEAVRNPSESRIPRYPYFRPESV